MAVLSDEARGAKGKVEKIRQSDILQAGHFYTVADFIDEQEGDIEDIFAPEVYAAIVNRSYALPECYSVTVEKLDQDTSTPRIVKKVEAIFKLIPDTIPMYDHYTPRRMVDSKSGRVGRRIRGVRKNTVGSGTCFREVQQSVAGLGGSRPRWLNGSPFACPAIKSK